MSELAGGSEPMEILSTHPSSSSRIEDLQAGLQETMPIYLQMKNAGKLPGCKAP